MQNLRLKAKYTIKSSVIHYRKAMGIPNSKYGVWRYFDILYFQAKSEVWSNFDNVYFHSKSLIESKKYLNIKCATLLKS